LFKRLIKKVISTSFAPDIVLSDFMMPITGRTAMLRRIKYDIRSSQIPLVILANRADIYSKLSCIGDNVEVYLILPSKRIRLKAVLKNLTGIGCKHQKSYVPLTLSEISDHTVPGYDGRFMQKILSLIDEKIDDDQFGVIEVCNVLGISRAQLYRKFKSHTDRTPHDYLRRYRLQKARELLLTTTYNVSEIAYRTGFKNVSHFSRIFAEEFGINPSGLTR
jgi:AraC-like DNA-binding protein